MTEKFVANLWQLLLHEEVPLFFFNHDAAAAV